MILQGIPLLYCHGILYFSWVRHQFHVALSAENLQTLLQPYTNLGSAYNIARAGPWREV